MSHHSAYQEAAWFSIQNFVSHVDSATVWEISSQMHDLPIALSPSTIWREGEPYLCLEFPHKNESQWEAMPDTWRSSPPRHRFSCSLPSVTLLDNMVPTYPEDLG